MDTIVENPRIKSQIDTPHKWILDGRMFRILSWEIEEEEIRELLHREIGDEYSLNLIRSKEGELKGITLVYLKDPEKVEKLRTTLLITATGTELRKTSHLPVTVIPTRTIKTTAPMWITRKKIYNVFSKYNSDPNKYDIIVDQTLAKGIQYPVIRFHQTTVDRDGKNTRVKVVYVEFSPNPEYKNDSFIALSMEHRCRFKNAISGEEATLIFDKWTIEKEPKKEHKKEPKKEQVAILE